MSRVKVDGNWVRCGECNAKLFKVNKLLKPKVPIYDDFGKITGYTRSPNCEIEIKCKSKKNGKTCNAMNYGLL